MRITLYDTTLRDGAQQEGLSLSVDDKLKILRLLDTLEVDIVEGGWPGANPKDSELFARAKELPLSHTQLAAFGCTRRLDRVAKDDASLASLLDAGTDIVTIFGKSWRLHVDQVLSTTPETNLRMIEETVRYLRDAGRRVIFDAEHFFDGYRQDPTYAIETLLAAAQSGAETVVLCDTNGGSLPRDVRAAVVDAVRHLATPIGIHAHNDGGLASANSIAAIHAGATHVQGTVNGYGERCGNADLCTLIPTLALKLGRDVSAGRHLRRLTHLSEIVNEIANCNPNPQRPYVGRSAFAHKGGIHADAMIKCPESYQHVDPQYVGNQSRCIVSELSGRANLRLKAHELGLTLAHRNGGDISPRILARIKALEHQGFQFEGADASVELLIRRTEPDYAPPFILEDFHVLIQGHPEGGMRAEAAVKVSVGDRIAHTAADGNGPVNALDVAVRKALLPSFPEIEAVRLVDYKVRILDAEAGTAARTRVLITTSDGRRRWCTVGSGTNVIEASWLALADALEYALISPAIRTSEQRKVGEQT
jgi:2-isopropylmalate synthase